MKTSSISEAQSKQLELNKKAAHAILTRLKASLASSSTVIKNVEV